MSSQNDDGFTVVGNKSRNKRGGRGGSYGYGGNRGGSHGRGGGQHRGNSYRQSNSRGSNKYNQKNTSPNQFGQTDSNHTNNMNNQSKSIQSNKDTTTTFGTHTFNNQQQQQQISATTETNNVQTQKSANPQGTGKGVTEDKSTVPKASPAPAIKHQGKTLEVPVRTSSAPPSLEEQEKTTKASFIPAKTTNFTYYPPPHYNPMHSSAPYYPNHGVPPYGHSQNYMYQQQPMQQSQPPPQQQQQQPPRKPLTVVRKPIVIVNPATGEEVKLTKNNTESTTASEKPKENDSAISTVTKEDTKIDASKVASPVKEDEKKEEKKDEKEDEKKDEIITKDDENPSANQLDETVQTSENDKNEEEKERDNKEEEVTNHKEKESYEEEEEEEDEDDEEEEDDDDDNTQKKPLIYSKDELLKYKDHFKTPPKELEKFDIFFDHSSPTPNHSRYGEFSPGSKRSHRDGRGNKMGRNPKHHKNGQPKRKPVNTWAKTSDEGDKIKQDVLLILNKLTPEKFDRLFEQLLQIRIPNEDVFKKVIYAIYDMAVLSPHYSFLFARLCADYSEKLGKEKDTETSKFKKLLLNKCQEEFEQKKELEFDEQVSPEEREELELKQRKHNVGNITFIGELYKKKMLNERIMHEVIKKLLDLQSKNPSQHFPKPDDLELLVKLFTTIGKQLDHEKSQKYMDFYFLKMKAITTNKSYPSRIRYLILDVVELRENKWVPRIKQDKAKTIQEVRKEAEQEKFDKERELAQKTRGVGSGRYTKRQDSYHESRPRYDQKHTRYTKFKDPSKQGSSLAPPSSDVRNSGSSGFNQSNNAAETTDKNMYANLREEEEESGANPDSPTGQEEETGSKAPPPTDEEEDISEVENEEKLMKAVKSIVGDVVETEEIDDAIDDLKALKSASKESIMKFLMKSVSELHKTEERESAMKLIKKTFEEEVFGPLLYVQGATSLLKYIIEGEIHVDDPQILKRFGEVVGRMIALGFIKAEKFVSGIDYESLSGANIADIFASIFGGIKIERGDEGARKTFCEFPINILHLINPLKQTELNRYLKNAKDANLIGVEPISTIINSVAEKEDITSYIEKLNSSPQSQAATSAKIIASLIVGIETNSYFAKPASEEKETELFEFYSPVLDNLLAKGFSGDENTATGSKTLEEIAMFAKKANDATDVKQRLENLFKKKEWIH